MIEALTGYTYDELGKLNDFLWYYYSYIVFLVPMNTIMVYKLINPIDYRVLADPKAPFKRHLADIFLHITSYYPVIYYIIDLIARFGTNTIYTSCGASFALHHAISIYFLPKLYRVRYWPWFWVGPAALHAFLLRWPDELWLNYIYLTSIILFQVGLYQKPWTHLKEYNFMKKGIVLIEIACVFLWLFTCKNTLI